MTQRQKIVYNAIIGFIDDNKRSPSYQEVADIFGVSKQAIRTMCDRLIAQGYLAREGHGYKSNIVKNIKKDVGEATKTLSRMR